jgi:hypothetical protein
MKFLLYSSNLSKICVIFNSFAICAFVLIQQNQYFVRIKYQIIMIFHKKEFIQKLKPAPVLKHDAKNTYGRMEAPLHFWARQRWVVNLYSLPLFHHTSPRYPLDRHLVGFQTYYEHVQTKEVTTPAWYQVAAPWYPKPQAHRTRQSDLSDLFGREKKPSALRCW